MGEILKGIKACYHEINNKKEFTIVPDVTVYLISGRKHKFVVENDPTILGANTTDPKATIANAKWAFILSYYREEATKTQGEEMLPLWADFAGKKEPIKFLGIQQQYKAGTSIEITPDHNDVWLGSFYRMEVFSLIPGQGLSFTFITIDKPKIYLAYFDKQDIKPVVKEFTVNDGYYSYGQVIKFYVATHMLPMKIGEQYSAKYGHIDSETVFEDLEVEIQLTDENYQNLLDEPIIKGKLKDYSPAALSIEGSGRISNGSANIQYEFPILLDYKWKDSIHKKEQKIRNYSATIKITNTKTKKTYSFTPNTNQIRTISETHRDFKNIDVSPIFSVKYDSMETILSQIEVVKNDMIQYIGDIDYNYKESNPCAYSKISISNDGKNYEIFNEYALTGKEIKDNTEGFIDVVCGDKVAKDVVIKAKFISKKGGEEEHVRTNKNGFACQMILNDGKPHDGIRDVFKMDWIIGQYKPSTDPKYFLQRIFGTSSVSSFPVTYHPSNFEKAPKLTGSKIPTDQEMKGTPLPSNIVDIFKPLTISGIQGLAETTDYVISEADDSITLKLKYIYNKSYDDSILKYLYGEQDYLKDGLLSDNVKNLWVVRYLLKWFKNEQIHQSYFVPVTTCRYSNQVAKVRVFPDMKWVINFNYNIKTPLYYKATTNMIEYYSGFNEGKINTSNNNKRKDIMDKSVSNVLKSYVGSKSTFGIYVECEVSGEDDVIQLGKDFGEKYRRMLAPFFEMIGLLDTNFGVSDAKNESLKIKTGPSPKGLKARLESLPMSFELKPPGLGLGLGIGYATSESGKITYGLDARIKADPIIGANVTLDILALGSKLKPWGAIIDALDLASWLINAFSAGHVEIDYKIEVRFTADIKLVGKKLSDKTVDKEAQYESEARFTYNFLDKKFDFFGGIQGKILGEIEISTSVKIKANVKDATGKPEEEKEDLAELSIGAKASSSVTITCPFNVNQDGKLDVTLDFSGVKLEIWFKVGFSSKDSKGKKPDKIVSLLPKFDLKKEIEF